MTDLIELRNVTKIFGGGWFSRSSTVALDDFSFSISSERPTITALVGESGSGKTTLARLVLGLTSPNSGEVLYRGKNLYDQTKEERRDFLQDVQIIFQDPFEVFNPFYKVDHVLMLPVRKFRLATSKNEGLHLIRDTLSKVGLRPEDTLGRFPHQLSGGQRQRVMVARALLLRPKLIIADEPVSMLDASLRFNILETLKSLHDEFGMSILYITHDLTTAYEVAENIIVLYRGRVAEIGEVETIIHHPEHPYTQLLISSIPSPDPDNRWRETTNKPNSAEKIDELHTESGCKFAAMCAFRMPEVS